MSSFSSKRKPRAIRTFGGDDDDEPDASTQTAPNDVPKDGSAAQTAPLKFGKRPFKHSSLRKSINANDASSLREAAAGIIPNSDPTSGADENEDDGPVVVRPALSRAGSTKQKKKRLSSRLSFGGDAGGGDGDDGDIGGGAFSTPKKSSLSAKALENSAIRSRLPMPMAAPPPRQSHDDDERPRYSKEYLEELASSTPNTPRDMSTLRIADDDDEMALDASELEGAVVVPNTELASLPSESGGVVASVLTEAQIRERKERRARIALEQEYMPLDEGTDDEENGYISLRSKPKKKEESRLIAEDEDLYEGYEEIVEDSRGLSLGKKAEREARRRHRAEMAEMISAAQGEDDGVSSDDSEAERRAAYEAAQTRAGMDGLQRRRGRGAGDESDDDDAGGDGGPGAIPKMKPLPDLSECLAKMQTLLSGMKGDVATKRARIVDLETEKAEILARETEVQGILDQAGKKYQAAAGSTTNSTIADVPPLSATQSPLRVLPTGLGMGMSIGPLPVERGLESFGTTPTRNRDVGDEEMG